MLTFPQFKVLHNHIQNPEEEKYYNPGVWGALLKRGYIWTMDGLVTEAGKQAYDNQKKIIKELINMLNSTKSSIPIYKLPGGMRTAEFLVRANIASWDYYTIYNPKVTKTTMIPLIAEELGI